MKKEIKILSKSHREVKKKKAHEERAIRAGCVRALYHQRRANRKPANYLSNVTYT